jgi:hypothetical protein
MDLWKILDKWLLILKFTANLESLDGNEEMENALRSWMNMHANKRILLPKM